MKRLALLLPLLALAAAPARAQDSVEQTVHHLFSGPVWDGLWMVILLVGLYDCGRAAVAFFRKRRSLRAYHRMYPRSEIAEGDLSAADPADPSRLRVTFRGTDGAVRVVDDPKGLPDLAGQPDLPYRAKDRVVVFAGPDIPGSLLLGHVLFRPKRTCISRRTVNRTVVGFWVLIPVAILAFALFAAFSGVAISDRAFFVFVVVIFGFACLPTVLFAAYDAAGLVAPRGYPIVPPPVLPATWNPDADEPHAEGAESESHAENAETAETAEL